MINSAHNMCSRIIYRRITRFQGLQETTTHTLRNNIRSKKSKTYHVTRMTAERLQCPSLERERSLNRVWTIAKGRLISNVSRRATFTSESRCSRKFPNESHMKSWSDDTLSTGESIWRLEWCVAINICVSERFVEKKNVSNKITVDYLPQIIRVYSWKLQRDKKVRFLFNCKKYLL